MFRSIALTLALLHAGTTAADEADQLETVIGYIAEQPERPTVLLHQKKLQRQHDMDLLSGIAEATGLDVEFKRFYGSEISKTRNIERLRDEGYERVVFLGDGDAARDFLVAARDIDWAPEFVTTHGFADEILNGEGLNYPGQILVAVPESTEQTAGVLMSTDAKVVLDRMLVTTEQNEKALLALRVGGRPMCEKIRKPGSRIRYTTCWSSAEARDVRRERDQQWIKRMKRSILDRQPKCFGMRQYTGNC